MSITEPNPHPSPPLAPRLPSPLASPRPYSPPRPVPPPIAVPRFTCYHTSTRLHKSHLTHGSPACRWPPQEHFDERHDWIVERKQEDILYWRERMVQDAGEDDVAGGDEEEDAPMHNKHSDAAGLYGTQGRGGNAGDGNIDDDGDDEIDDDDDGEIDDDDDDDGGGESEDDGDDKDDDGDDNEPASPAAQRAVAISKLREVLDAEPEEEHIEAYMHDPDGFVAEHVAEEGTPTAAEGINQSFIEPLDSPMAEQADASMVEANAADVSTSFIDIDNDAALAALAQQQEAAEQAVRDLHAALSGLLTETPVGQPPDADEFRTTYSWIHEASNEPQEVSYGVGLMDDIYGSCRFAYIALRGVDKGKAIICMPDGEIKSRTRHHLRRARSICTLGPSCGGVWAASVPLFSFGGR